MLDYSKSKIYKIVCNVSGLQYFGSTVSPLKVRLQQHRRAVGCTSRKVLESGDFSIILVEDFPCDRKETLLARERYYIETFECVNKKYPGRTQHEWYQDNRERLIDAQKKWNIENKEKLAGYQKKYREKGLGIYIDLNEIELEDENIKLAIEDLTHDEKIDIIDSFIL